MHGSPPVADRRPVSSAPRPVRGHRRRYLGVLRYAGPGLLVSVGYMDPGNWATDIEAGSHYGYALLFVVLLSGLAAMQLQSLSMRLGIVTGQDLARLTRERYGRAAAWFLWPIAEIAMIATDIAEVLGSALALQLLFGLPLWIGVLVTVFDTLLILGLRGKGIGRVETITLGLVATITLCFVIQLLLVHPDPAQVAAGLLPSDVLSDPRALYVAIGIIGATVMPHNLYLHSSVVRSRFGRSDSAKDRGLRFATIDMLAALGLAIFVNAAILALAAAAFHATGHHGVTDIAEAYRLLTPLTGARAAAILFGVALLASGQSATFTGTIAGQVVLEGFTSFRLAAWQRRAITRGLALIPALIGVLLFGSHATGTMLILTQVVLSIALPFTVYPLIRLTGAPDLMGRHVAGMPAKSVAWSLLLLIVAADICLLREAIAIP